jgi:hypothetical protein
VSLILEALKKLERERDSTGRGFLVVAHTPWPATRARAARLVLMAVAAGALAGTAAWGVWTWLATSSRDPVKATTAGAAAAGHRPASPLPPPIWETTAAAAAPVAPSTTVKPSALPPAAPATPDEPRLLVITPRTAPAAQPVLRLEAISSQDGQPVAVINGHLVRKGETIEGALVTWIGADAVEIEVDGRRRVIGF